MAVERELASQRGGLPAELALPERIADHHARRTTAAAIVGGCEDASKDRRHAQHIESVAAHPEAFGVAGLAAAGQVEGLVAPREDSRERLLLLAD